MPHALCRPLAHACPAPQRNDIDGHCDRCDRGPGIRGGTAVAAVQRSVPRSLRSVPRSRLTPDGRAGLPGTASRLGPAGWHGPPLARRSPRTTSRRWPARGRRWPAGLQGSAFRRPAAGGQLGSNGALRRCGRRLSPDDRANQCSHAAIVDLSR